MTINRKRIAKAGLILAIVLAPILGYLLWPIRTDKTIMQPEPGVLRGKQSYLANTKANPGAPHPNVVVMLADDLGEFDISLYGGKDVRTPNIDSLARSGVTFTDGYCTSPICSPSRAGLLTGRYQQRFGHELQPGDSYPGSRLEILLGNGLIFTKEWKLNEPRRYPNRASMDAQGLRQSEITFAELAKAQGYSTGAIGKWHLGYAHGLTPQDRGFDYYYGFLAGASLYSPLEAPDIIYHRHSNLVDLAARFARRRGTRAIQRNGQVIQERHYLTETIAQEAVAFIDRHKDKPFLLYVPFNAPHEPFQVPTRYYERFKEVEDTNKRTYYAMISALDEAVGAIVKKVRDAGLEEKTLLVFASDNGGATYTLATMNGPLKGGKLSHFEGGINVPFLMSWKGTIPPSTVYREPVSLLDVFPTIAASIHAPLPPDRPYDGVDLISKVLKQEQAHEALFWRSGTSKAVRKRNWKLVISERSGKVWLYDLAADRSETTDLSRKRPEVVAELEALLREWEKQLAAPLWPSPVRNELRFGDDLYIFDI